MPRHIWIVRGSTGEHSDYQEWDVLAFTNSKKAATYAQQANTWLENHGAHTESPAAESTFFKNRHEIKAANPYDLNMQLDYTGARYGVAKVPLA